MVKLRLRRKGRRHLPFYDIVAIDGRKRRDGAFLERIGYFDPNERPSKVNVDSDRAVYWLSVGAQPSDVVRKLLQYEGVLLRKAMMHKG
ncbi:MAG: 30S ribosomal protein S16, partial [Bacteroidota bacterium]